jgi:hypothetical protein
MATGAAVASASSAAATSSAYAAGVAAGSAGTAAATSAAYTAGVATGAAAAGAAAAPAVPASGTWVMGMSYATLPAGSMTINKNGQTYFLNGNTWFKPAYGANGVFYTVVAAP